MNNEGDVTGLKSNVIVVPHVLGENKVRLSARTYSKEIKCVIVR